MKLTSKAQRGRILILLLGVVCFLPALVAAQEPVLSGVGTATVNGVLSPGEWDGAGTSEFLANVPGGGTTPATLFVMNDAVNLYLAVRFQRSVVDAGNSLGFDFDANNNGFLDVGDDAIVHNVAAGFFDDTWTNEPPCPPDALCGLFDTDVGGTNDGAGAFSNDGTHSTYELSHPLNSGDVGHDFALGPGDVVGFRLHLRMIQLPGNFPDGFGDTDFPQFGRFGQITISSLARIVNIDIKPGSDPNSVNCTNANGVIPVAILSTSDFDATGVDHTTVRFGKTGNEAAEIHSNKKGIIRHEEDVDGDGDRDLVFHFRFGDTGIGCGDTEASLTGETFSGQAITGSDAIRTVGGGTGPVSFQPQAVPPSFLLGQNYPNPFNPTTEIRFALPEATHVELRIFNTLGEQIRTLLDANYVAGYYSVRWDGKDQNGNAVASGVYVYRIQAGEIVATEKLVLLR